MTGPDSGRDELLDLVDEHDRVLGTVAKSLANRDPALIHREVAVLIHHGERLLWQQRSTVKEVLPGMWDISCAGHVVAGERPETAAHRELAEELGFDTALRFAGRRLVRLSWESYIAHVFWGAAPPGVGPLLDPGEVAAIQWGDARDLARWQAEGRPLSPVAIELAERFWRRGRRRHWAAQALPARAG
jgi:isopentenyldiphosphate isomerase